jgi:hypothetical protein
LTMRGLRTKLDRKEISNCLCFCFLGNTLPTIVLQGWDIVPSLPCISSEMKNLRVCII